jgi:hypothetical protein
MLIDEGPEFGTALSAASGLAVGPLVGEWLVVVDRAENGLPLGLDEGSFTGLLLGSRLMDGTVIGLELCETAGMSDGPLLGAWLDEDEGAEDGLLLGIKEGSLTGLSLVVILSDEGPELGTALGAASGLAIGGLLGDWLVAVDGAEYGLPLGLEEAYCTGLSLGLRIMDGTELGFELGETAGILDGPLLGAWLLEVEGAEDGLLLGPKEGPSTGLSLGSMLHNVGLELSTALGVTSGLDVGPRLGGWLVPVDGAEDGLPLGLDEGSFTWLSLGSRVMDGAELDLELGETTGISAGPLLGFWLDEAEGAEDGLLLGLEEGPLTGSLLSDEGPVLGIELNATTGLSVGPLLGVWLVAVDGAEDGLGDGSLTGLSRGSLLKDGP